MRIIQISLCISALALFVAACGNETDDPPTALAPTEVPTSTSVPTTAATVAPTEAPTSAPVPTTAVTVAPTEAISTSTPEPPAETKVEEESPPTVPPKATEPPPTEPPAAKVAPERDLDIVTLLPPDAIRSIDSPGFFKTIEQADKFYREDEYVLGVEIDGDARAYSVPLLSSHEIVNDTVGGRPIAVTW